MKASLFGHTICVTGVLNIIIKTMLIFQNRTYSASNSVAVGIAIFAPEHFLWSANHESNWIQLQIGKSWARDGKILFAVSGESFWFLETLLGDVQWPWYRGESCCEVYPYLLTSTYPVLPASLCVFTSLLLPLFISILDIYVFPHSRTMYRVFKVVGTCHWTCLVNQIIIYRYLNPC